jgi:hypothetical protein
VHGAFVGATIIGDIIRDGVRGSHRVVREIVGAGIEDTALAGYKMKFAQHLPSKC